MSANEPAFPHLVDTCQRINQNEMYSGLSKRELFASTAMQGLLANGQAESIVSRAIALADALIAELSK